MSASIRYGGISGHPLRPVSDPESGVERAYSATSVMELAGEPNLEREIRIDPEGVVTAEGPTEDHFTEALSYGARLAALVGELLGLDRLTTIDLQFKNKRWALVTLQSGEVVAKRVVGPEDLKRFKQRVGD